MSGLKTYSLEEIGMRLEEENFPFSGITCLGSATFHFIEPASTMGVALHNGSRVRPQLAEALAVGQDDRFREEDPYTELFIQDFPIQLIARDSRFEYDLNWEIEKCIYPYGKKKWGLQVWNRSLTPDEIETTYSKYREFHALFDLIVEYLVKHHPVVTIFDIHSYCYQRDTTGPWWEDRKPEINLGTRYINRDYFTPLIDLFLESVSDIVIEGYPVRVGEDVVFPGGYLTRKCAEKQERRVLVLAIEYKKIFMDEKTGELFPGIVELLIDNLVLTKDRILRTKL